MKAGYVYIMASGRNGTIYIGSTSDLVNRAWAASQRKRAGLHSQARMQISSSGMRRTTICRMARLRELQMKKWKRPWKLTTIEQLNPEWDDLYASLR